MVAVAVAVRGLHARRGAIAVLRGVDLEVAPGAIVAVVGPAQAGKTTLLQCLSRMSDDDPGLAVRGEIRIGGVDARTVVDVASLRRRVGLVAPLPVALPMTILENVTFAPRMAGVRRKDELLARAQACLRAAALWDEVKDRLDELATRLSGGQQQRLAIARALSHDPEVLCLDEFSIAIDPITTERIEAALRAMRGRHTTVLVTNLAHQARRLADVIAMMSQGRIVEVQSTAEFFARPRHEASARWLEGQLG